MASLTAANLADAHIEKHGLAGEHVVVTGRTTGIDRAIALLLASEGAQALICSRDEKHLAEALALSQSVTVAIEREWDPQLCDLYARLDAVRLGKQPLSDSRDSALTFATRSSRWRPTPVRADLRRLPLERERAGP